MRLISSIFMVCPFCVICTRGKYGTADGTRRDCKIGKPSKRRHSPMRGAVKTSLSVLRSAAINASWIRRLVRVLNDSGFAELFFLDRGRGLLGGRRLQRGIR